MIRRLAGTAAALLLKGIARIPIGIAFALGCALLPLYIPFRPRTRMRLRILRTPPRGAGTRNLHAPSLTSRAYYRMRLRLSLHSLRHLLGLPDGLTRKVGGGALYRTALESGKPVVLVGWHHGPIELLHRVPAEAAAGRPFFVMTAGAFAPELAQLMRGGRSGPGKEVLAPGDRAGLRRWVRDKGVLALMVDQAPGDPGAWLEVCGGSVRLPWPARLIEWLRGQDAVWLAVETRWLPGNEARFDYRALQQNGRRAEIGNLVTENLRASAGQYNWSYGKVRVEANK